jgi:ribose transport system substrate-binding protein
MLSMPAHPLDGFVRRSAPLLDTAGESSLHPLGLPINLPTAVRAETQKTIAQVAKTGAFSGTRGCTMAINRGSYVCAVPTEIIRKQDAISTLKSERKKLRLGKINRRVISILSAASVLASLSSCKDAPTRIAVIPRACGTALWEPEHAGAADAARAHGMTIYWNAPTRANDVQKQIALLEKVVAKHYQGVILAPDETLALRTPVRSVLAKHIPIVVVGTELGIAPDSRLSYVLNDEVGGGQLAARRVGLVLGGTGSVAVLGLDPKLWNITLRERSFEQTLASEFPNVRVIARRIGLANVPQEQQVVEELLQNEPTPDALVALSAESTRGAYYALVEFNKTPAIKLIGFDQDLLPPIRTGGLDSVVVQNTYDIGRAAIEQIQEKLHGETLPDKVIVEPKLLTRDNIDSPAMQKIFSAHWWTDQ